MELTGSRLPERVAIAKTHNANPEDAHFYTILQNYNTNEEWAKAKGVVPSLSCVYYRKDIWEKLGSPEMETMEDLINVCKMVQEQYPDMIPVNAGQPHLEAVTLCLLVRRGNEFI